MTILLAVAIQAVTAPPRPNIPIRVPVRIEQPTGPIEAVLLSPLFDAPAACIEHYDGQLDFVGDALGTDCQPVGGIETVGHPQLYRTDGKANEDWYGWNALVHSPIDGKVVGLLVRPGLNSPGTLGRPPANMLQIERTDGILVTLAHITGPTVKIGDTVKAGQPIASVGNNGMSRSPHIHVGVSRGKTPLQIRWDQKAMARLLKD